MRICLLLTIAFAVAICRTALAQDKYTFHENLHVGMRIPVSLVYECKSKSTSTMNGIPTVSDTTTRLDWKMTMIVLAVKDGSSMRAQVDIDPGSSDTNTVAGQSSKKTACPFAGKTITITRNPDESFTNDFSGTADDNDLDQLNNSISPDEDYYPDHPVAVGDTWDVSANLAKHSQLGPGDQLLSQCRLDWVKIVNGKPMAQISNSLAIVYHEPGHVEEDFEATGTVIVDLTTQMIVKGDQTATSKYKTPPNEPFQITGGTEITFHDELLPQ
jgi:hypothetical protein